MNEISVGRVVGWGSDMPYCEHIQSEGRVVAREGAYLVILNEKLAAEIPHANPFVIRRAEHVWLVEKVRDAAFV